MLSISPLLEAARYAADKTSEPVLRVLSVATSALLRPNRWNEPFDPLVAALGGHRSPLPSDLDANDLALLSRIAHLMDDTDNASLRARVCDVSWFYGNRADVELLDDAIAAYIAVPLTFDAWHAEGRNEWERALELAVRRGKDGYAQMQAMTSALLDRLRSGEGASGYFGVQLSEMIREHRLAAKDKDEASQVAMLCVQRASDARESANWRVERGWEQEATLWFRSLNLRDEASAAQARLAESFISEADDRRRGVGGGAITASHFVELALKTLLEIPRTYRTAHTLDTRIADLRTVLAEDRQVLLDSMVPMHEESVDLTEQVADARRRVDGQDKVAALGALGMLSPLASFEAVMSHAKAAIQDFPLSSLFGRETYSSSGQKVFPRPGVDMALPSAPDEEPDGILWSAMVRDHEILTSLVVQGRILPALELIRLQHQFSAALLFDLCRHSPFIPSGHEWTWARGLLHGLDGDFVSAVCVLAPQIEHAVRVQMKHAEAHTLVTDEHGIETEKGLSALLDDQKSIEVLGVDLCFELKALFTASVGPNLRNVIAHGLASDGHLMGHSAVYAWWLAVRMAVFSWAPNQDVGNADTHPMEDSESREDGQEPPPL
ncbi:MAG TPA: DUF4209 domain-containing protein [Acidobacteriaceae bacterium]|nr:DUF4209 domain-containing protein [Acidobacteriaceae bacterium]